jgi:hypothetical protein
MARAAGGTSQRLKAGPAMMRCLSNNPGEDVMCCLHGYGFFDAILVESRGEYLRTKKARPMDSKYALIRKLNVALQQK